MSEQELKAALEAAVPGLEVEESDRPCPVQVHGTIDGIGFYFRARNARWYLAIASKRGDNPVDVALSKVEGWLHEEPYGEHPDAGWMSDADVVRCIAKAVGTWRGREKATTNPYPKPESCGYPGCAIAPGPTSGMRPCGVCRCHTNPTTLTAALRWYRWEYEHRGQP